MYPRVDPREMEMGSKERDGGGEGKSLAYERGSVRGETDFVS